jgi:hypothetical protein
MKKYALFTLLAIAIPTAAQTTQKDVLIKHWKTSGDFTVAVASAMPADGYTFRPTPAEMSFGELMAHIAALDRNACANASGLTPPALPAKIEAWVQNTEKVEVDKETAIQFIKGSFEFCNKPSPTCPRAAWTALLARQRGHDWLRMALVLFHAHCAPSRTGGSVPAIEGDQAARVRVLRQ